MRLNARYQRRWSVNRRLRTLYVHTFTGALRRVRFGTCRFTGHARSAPIRAVRAYGMHLRVRNATHRNPPVTI